MVEANQYSDEENEQTFIEKPDILDKFKGAEAQQLVQSCPMGVFDIEESQADSV